MSGGAIAARRIPRWVHDPAPARWYRWLRRRLVHVALTISCMALAVLLGFWR